LVDKNTYFASFTQSQPNEVWLIRKHTAPSYPFGVRVGSYSLNNSKHQKVVWFDPIFYKGETQKHTQAKVVKNLASLKRTKKSQC
jgi:hypothetical protein